MRARTASQQFPFKLTKYLIRTFTKYLFWNCDEMTDRSAGFVVQIAITSWHVLIMKVISQWYTRSSIGIDWLHPVCCTTCLQYFAGTACKFLDPLIAIFLAASHAPIQFRRIVHGADVRGLFQFRLIFIYFLIVDGDVCHGQICCHIGCSGHQQ